jgi:hypothetical protein
LQVRGASPHLPPRSARFRPKNLVRECDRPLRCHRPPAMPAKGSGQQARGESLSRRWFQYRKKRGPSKDSSEKADKIRRSDCSTAKLCGPPRDAARFNFMRLRPQLWRASSLVCADETVSKGYRDKSSRHRGTEHRPRHRKDCSRKSVLPLQQCRAMQ